MRHPNMEEEIFGSEYTLRRRGPGTSFFARLARRLARRGSSRSRQLRETLLSITIRRRKALFLIFTRTAGVLEIRRAEPPRGEISRFSIRPSACIGGRAVPAPSSLNRARGCERSQPLPFIAFVHGPAVATCRQPESDFWGRPEPYWRGGAWELSSGCPKSRGPFFFESIPEGSCRPAAGGDELVTLCEPWATLFFSRSIRIR